MCSNVFPSDAGNDDTFQQVVDWYKCVSSERSRLPESLVRGRNFMGRNAVCTTTCGPASFRLGCASTDPRSRTPGLTVGPLVRRTRLPFPHLRIVLLGSGRISEPSPILTPPASQAPVRGAAHQLRRSRRVEATRSIGSIGYIHILLRVLLCPLMRMLLF